jgi:hypothetical protein
VDFVTDVVFVFQQLLFVPVHPMLPQLAASHQWSENRSLAKMYNCQSDLMYYMPLLDIEPR